MTNSHVLAKGIVVSVVMALIYAEYIMHMRLADKFDDLTRELILNYLPCEWCSGFGPNKSWGSEGCTTGYDCTDCQRYFCGKDCLRAHEYRCGLHHCYSCMKTHRGYELECKYLAYNNGAYIPLHTGVWVTPDGKFTDVDPNKPELEGPDYQLVKRRRLYVLPDVFLSLTAEEVTRAARFSEKYPRYYREKWMEFDEKMNRMLHKHYGKQDNGEPDDVESIPSPEPDPESDGDGESRVIPRSHQP